MILGVIADDFTGATDVASMLVRAGMRTVQVIGVPDAAGASAASLHADAVVVALKSRTTPAAEAVAESLAALRWLQAGGARQFYFKYCSTFDSTAEGNIGPVAEALLAALDSDFTIACPAFPENGRSVYMGHLFVGEQLLSDSGMRHHPLTPMTDANLVRVLQAQCQGRVGLARHDVVARGAEALKARLDELRASGHRFAVADAIDNQSLRTLAEACADLPLITAGSGVALGLPAVYEARGWLRPDAEAATLPTVGGRAAVLSGSCSSATNAQVQHWLAQGHPAFRVDARALAEGQDLAQARAMQWASQPEQASVPVLVYATAQPDEVRAVQDALGVQRAGALVEHCLAAVAQGLHAQGVRRLVVAGGETSGAVVQALGVQRLRIGAPIDPGVPWTQAEGQPLLLALKSGNFGSVDFFSKALGLTA
jgi:3-dehydrotetronate 4-kinase